MKDDVGQPLREAREARHWSVEDVAEKLRISARYVIAIEDGDVDALPEPTFVRGYVKAYAKAVGLNADALVAALAPVEVKAPRPLIGPDGQASTSRRVKAGGRAPSFRSSGSHRRHWMLGGLIAVVAGGWMAWPQRDEVVPSAPSMTSTVAAQPASVATASADAALPSVATGGVTLEVPLPGAAPVPASAAGSSVAATGQVPAAVPAGTATTVATPAAVAGNPSAATLPAAAGSPVATPSSATASAVAVPRKGLHARFTSTCWVEVRDADNVVIYTRIAMPGSELSLEGKAPLTVTLGDASAASVWYNGDRIVADRFSTSGIARLIVGQALR